MLDWAVGEYYGDRKYYAQHGWPKLVALWAGAASVYAMRRFLGVPGEDTGLGTGFDNAPQTAAGESELFYVKARYWPAVLFVLGLVFAFVRKG